MEVSVPVVGNSYVAGVRELELIASSRESIVYKVIDAQGNNLIRKSYPLVPQVRPKKSGSRDPYLVSSPTLDQQKSRFNREVEIIHQSSLLPESERYAPDLVAVHESSRSFFMRSIPGDTFLDFFSSSDNYRIKATAYIEALNILHAKWNRRLPQIYSQVRTGKSFALQPRKKEEDFNRWRGYFRTIVYSASPACVEYLRTLSSRNRIRNAKSVRKGINREIDSFLKGQQIVFNDFVRDFVNLDWSIGYGNQEKAVVRAAEDIDALFKLYKSGVLSLVHRDFSNPSNVFVATSESSVRACDLVDMALAGRHVDVAAALFNFYNSPNGAEKETSAIELISLYREGVQREEGISLDPSHMIVACLEDRLRYEGVRLFAIDCRYSPAEIRERVGDIPEYSDVDDAEIQKRFLHDRFIRRLTGFGDYILRGEGYKATEGVGSINLLRRNVAAVEDFFTKSGVFPDLTASAKRHERVRAVARGDPPSKP